METKEVLEYSKNKNFDIQCAGGCIFICDMVYSQYVNSQKIHNSIFSPVFCYVSYTKVKSHYQLINTDIIKNTGKKIYIDYVLDNQSLQKKIDEHKKISESSNLVWKRYKEKKEAGLTNEELLSIYDDIIKLARECWQYTAIGEDKGNIIETRIVSNFMKRHNLEKSAAREIVYTLAHPNEMTLVNQQRKDFVKLCIKTIENNSSIRDILKDKKLSNMIKCYIDKYFWTKTNFYKSLPLESDDLIKSIFDEINNHSKRQLVEELDKIESNFKKILHEKNNQKILLTKEDKKDIKFAEKIILWIDLRKIWMMKHIYYLLTILKDLAEHNNINYHEISLYQVDEVRDFILSKKRVKKDILDKRHKSTFFVFEKNKKAHLIYGKDADLLFKTLVHNKKSTIKGMVSCIGNKEKIKGIINIVYDPSIENFEKGNILLTSMTRPEFIHLMRKSKAVITDEGGIACHAAIVSRELGIPCIIGTKNATQALKDGDYVEMDMTTGIVKIIE